MLKKTVLIILLLSFVFVNAQNSKTYKFIGVGDMMLGTNYPSEKYLPPKSFKLLQNVEDILKSADVTFGNLEGSVLNSGGDVKKCSDPSLCYAFRQPEYLIDQIVDAGFDLLSIANNHVGDFGNSGRKNTVRVLSEKGFCFAGLASRPWDTMSVDNLIIGFCAFSPNSGTLQINNQKKANEVVSFLDAIADIVVVSFHGGAEGAKNNHVTKKTEYYYGENRGNVCSFSHQLIDKGADIIFGHGPHVTRAIEVYKNRLICYSLGNFCTYNRFNLRGLCGIAPIVEVNVDKNGEFIFGNIIPIKQIENGYPIVDENKSVLVEIQNLIKTDFPDNHISFDGSKFQIAQ